MVAFAFIQGLNYALPTLVGQILEPCGFSPVVAGNASAALAAAGIVGCVVVAPIMAASKKYRLLQVALVCLVGAGVCLVLLNNRPGNLVGAPRSLRPLRRRRWRAAPSELHADRPLPAPTARPPPPALSAGVYVSWAALGLVQGPLGPLTFEHSAEITYPTSAENAASFMSLAINLWGFVEIIALTPLLQLPVSASCESVATPAAALVLACVAVSVVFVFLVKEDNRRVATEKKWEADELVRRDGGGGPCARAARPDPHGPRTECGAAAAQGGAAVDGRRAAGAVGAARLDGRGAAARVDGRALPAPEDLRQRHVAREHRQLVGVGPRGRGRVEQGRAREQARLPGEAQRRRGRRRRVQGQRVVAGAAAALMAP